MLKPRDAHTSTGEPLLDVLWSKYPEAHAPSGSILGTYPVQPPDLVNLDPVDNTEIQVSHSLSEGAGIGITD